MSLLFFSYNIKKLYNFSSSLIFLETSSYLSSNALNFSFPKFSVDKNLNIDNILL